MSFPIPRLTALLLSAAAAFVIAGPGPAGVWSPPRGAPIRQVGAAGRPAPDSPRRGGRLWRPPEPPPSPRRQPPSVSRTVGVTVQVRPADRQTLAFGLAQNSPNPFSGSTTIGYSLGRPSRVTIKLYTIAGERVATLVDRDQDAGRYALTWSGVDQRGRPLPAGLYLYRLQAGPHRTTRKLVIR